MSRAPLAFLPLLALAAACGPASSTPGTTVACTLAAGAAQTLASAIARTEFLALDDDHVYFQTQAGVFSVKKDGTALLKLPMTVPATVAPPAFDRQDLGGVAVDATDVYFAVGPTIFRMPKAGGTLAGFASSTGGSDGQIGEIVMDVVNVYWVDFYYGAVYLARKATPGGNFTTRLALAGRRPHYLAVDDATVFWTNEDDLSAYRVQKDGTGLATFHTGAGQLRGIAVDATLPFPVKPTANVSAAHAAEVASMKECIARLAAARTDTERGYQESRRPSLESSINRKVYYLYGLTPEEVSLVESYQPA